MEEKEFEIWIEGYAATGEHGTANYIGNATGQSFKEACENFTYPEDIMGYDSSTIIVHKGDRLKLDEGRHYDYPSIWACRLYDNEADARRSFG